jgi:hypothetical protein
MRHKETERAAIRHLVPPHQREERSVGGYLFMARCRCPVRVPAILVHEKSIIFMNEAMDLQVIL